MATTENAKVTGILLDCAASCHMFMDQKYFISYHESTSEFITVGGQNRVPVVDRGSIKFQAVLPHGYINLTIHNVLHTPQLGANLVSLGILHRQGITVRSWDKGLVLVKDGEELFRAALTGLSGTLYFVQYLDNNNDVAYHANGALSMRLQHRRMGYLNLRTIESMQNQQLVHGLEITASCKFNHLCSGCANGKSHCLPIPDSSMSHYSKMELLVMDLTSPMSVPTWDGYLYALVMVEVSYQYPVSRLLKKKEDTGTVVCNIIAMLEQQSGLKAHCICSDNGSEFVNSTMDQFYQCNGIIHKTTVPYFPQQNGLAEQAIAIFFEMVQCMIHIASMDLHYWDEAFMYAVHIRHLTLTIGLSGRVPYEAWTGHKPDVSYLHIFESLGQAHVPEEVRRGKLESRAVKVHILEWWTDETKGYCLEDLENSKLIATRDVCFAEDSFSSKLAVVKVDTPLSQMVTYYL